MKKRKMRVIFIIVGIKKPWENFTYQQVFDDDDNAMEVMSKFAHPKRFMVVKFIEADRKG